MTKQTTFEKRLGQQEATANTPAIEVVRRYLERNSAMDDPQIAPEQQDALREALEGLLGEMVSFFDLLNRQDPALLRKIERGQLETDNNLACQAARAALAETSV